MWSLGWPRPGWGSPSGRLASDSEGFHWPPASSSATGPARPSDSRTHTGWTKDCCERQKHKIFHQRCVAAQLRVEHEHRFSYILIYFGSGTCINMCILWKSRRSVERENKKERLSAGFIHLEEYTRDEEGEKWKRHRKCVKERKGYLDSDFCRSVLISFGFFCSAAHIIFMSGMSTECCGRRRWQLTPDRPVVDLNMLAHAGQRRMLGNPFSVVTHFCINTKVCHITKKVFLSLNQSKNHISKWILWKGYTATQPLWRHTAVVEEKHFAGLTKLMFAVCAAILMVCCCR